MPFNLKLKGIHYVSENLSKICVRSLLGPTVINSNAASVNAGGKLSDLERAAPARNLDGSPGWPR